MRLHYYVLWVLVLVISAACTQLLFLDTPDRPQEAPLMDEKIQREVQRMRYLLSPERTDQELEEIDPLLPAADVGAHVALAFRASDPEAVINIYIFDSWNQHPEAVTQLQAALPSTEGLHILNATNGPSLFFGYADISGENALAARYQLSGLVAAFAGDE
jgi:hypothetical protein